jgi:hypothetical protein
MKITSHQLSAMIAGLTRKQSNIARRTTWKASERAVAMAELKRVEDELTAVYARMMEEKRYHVEVEVKW